MPRRSHFDSEFDRSFTGIQSSRRVTIQKFEEYASVLVSSLPFSKIKQALLKVIFTKVPGVLISEKIHGDHGEDGRDED